jgi:tripartite-type tricarboxylate transporter receptor subunit TctC
MRRLIAAVALLLAGAFGARADEASLAEFYRGKQITMISGFQPGETSEAYARLLARHMPNHIPGRPAMVEQIMLGAGTLKALQHVYHQAPRDGTALGIVQRASLLLPLFDEKTANLDGARLGYIGSSNRETLVLVAWNTAGQRSVEDLKRTPLIIGTTGSGVLITNVAAALDKVLGLKFKVIAGYAATPDINLALERGEIEGRFLSYSSVEVGEWLAAGKARILLQMGLGKIPALGTTPSLFDLVGDPTDKQALKLLFGTDDMGRPVIAPPEMPAERLAALRAAFVRTMRDPDFKAEAEHEKLAVDPMEGSEMESVMQDLYRVPKSIVQHALDIQKPR